MEQAAFQTLCASIQLLAKPKPCSRPPLRQELMDEMFAVEKATPEIQTFIDTLTNADITAEQRSALNESLNKLMSRINEGIRLMENWERSQTASQQSSAEFAKQERIGEEKHHDAEIGAGMAADSARKSLPKMKETAEGLQKLIDAMVS